MGVLALPSAKLFLQREWLGWGGGGNLILGYWYQFYSSSNS